MSSDHFSPWSERQGHSGFAWAWLSAALATTSIPFADPHDYLAALRSFLGRRRGDCLLLGEVNLPYSEQKKFFGGRDGDELTMMFDFVGMQNLYLSLAREGARPLARTLKRRPTINPDAQWASFLRNHDEITLDNLRASATRSLPPSAQNPSCSSSAEDCGVDCRPCSTATLAGSRRPTA